MSCVAALSLAMCQAFLLNMHNSLQYILVGADTENFAKFVNYLILISYPAIVTMFSCTDSVTFLNHLYLPLTTLHAEAAVLLD